MIVRKFHSDSSANSKLQNSATLDITSSVAMTLPFRPGRSVRDFVYEQLSFPEPLNDRPATMNYNRVAIPTLVRIKTGALGRMGTYLSRHGHRRVAVFQSAGALDDISSRLRCGLESASIDPIVWVDVAANEFERAISYLTDLPPSVTAIVGLGGGKALDVAKYV